MRSDNSEVSKLLLMLEAVGRIKRQPWGVTLNQAPSIPPISVSLGDAEVRSQAVAPPTLPRPRKCYDYDAPAIEGKARCEKHLAIVRESSKRSHARRKIYRRSHPIWERPNVPGVPGREIATVSKAAAKARSKKGAERPSEVAATKAPLPMSSNIS
jgi:hypothetical protein